ncbi:MAG: RDD family protein [Rhodothermales bacterium]|nr:RDD family protein [Rhodothermales bacterium]
METNPAPRTVEPAAEPAPAPAGAPRQSASAKPDVAKRFIAKFVDGIVAAVLYWVVAAVVPGWFAGYVLGGIVAGAYLLVSDGLDVDFMKQRSLGKKLLGFDVNRLDGQPMDLATSARRNWMFVIGYFSQAFIFSAPALSTLISIVALGIVLYECYRVLTDPAGRRWGDEFAGTQVTETVG